jgi:D-alanyl-D-alanine dipeptidase
VSAPTSIISIVDPRVLAIPIVENDEPLVELKTQTDIAYGPSPEIPDNKDYTKMRQTVYASLCEAQALLPKGLRLCLYEGYRSLELQSYLFDTHFSEIQKLHPEWSTDNIFDETTKLVSPLINKDGSPNIPAHSTGGAVDVYLVDITGKAVDMGILVKDWMEDRDGSLSQTDSHLISGEAQEHRKIMARALSSVGFINYPTEYWHWSYGDRYWAYHTTHPHALYGSVK